MILKLFALLPLVLAAASAMAETPSLDLLKDRRYAIRSGTAPRNTDNSYRTGGGAGVWDWNFEEGTWNRLFPLIYGELGLGYGASLAATEDRIIVQGETFLEFDAVTHRLLRRYQALDSEKDRWSFGGTLVTDQLATRLGIAPGYYGHAECPPSGGVLGPVCSNTSFPGYPAPTFRDTRWNLLQHRQADPAGIELMLAKTLPAATSEPLFETWRLALDVDRSRFWFMHHLRAESQIRFGYLPIGHGDIGDPVVLETQAFPPGTPHTSWRNPDALFYDSTTDSLLTLWNTESSDSYVTRRPGDLSMPEQVVASGDQLPVALATLVPGLPEVYEQVVPAIASGAGAHGTFWQSDVWIFNPSEAAVSFTIRRVSNPGMSVQRDLAPGASLELADVLGMLGGGSTDTGGDGIATDALVVAAPYRWGAQLAVHSRTYTSNGASGGTYGQSVPAVPTREGYSTHLQHAQVAGPVIALASQFYLDLRYPGMFRHNFGIVNDSAEPIEMDLYYGFSSVSPDRQPTRTITVAPHSVANVNLDSLFSAEMVHTRPSIVLIAGSRPAPVWLSMVDNKTGDATFLPFATFSMEGAYESSMIIPQIAHTPGARDSYWRSDLYGLFSAPASFEAQMVSAVFHPSDPASCGELGEPRETVLTGPTGQPGQPQDYPFPHYLRRVFPDVVKQFDECTEEGITGALELNIGSWMSGFARTYTTREDGGTYGDMLPFYPADGWPVQHFSGVKIGDEFRTNLGLHNGLDYPVVHRLVIYDSGGNEVRRHEVTLEPRRSMQAPIAAIVGELTPGLYGLTVLPLDAEGRAGRSWAYVSIVDNLTGDPTNLW